MPVWKEILLALIAPQLFNKIRMRRLEILYQEYKEK